MTLTLYYNQNLPFTILQLTAGEMVALVLVRKHLINSINNVSKISERIISVTFQCNAVINITTYAPKETSSEQEKERFHNYLNDSVASIPQHNFVVMAGVFNARIGSKSHETNTNEQYLVDFCKEQDLISAFQFQPSRRNHMWTWEHPNMRSKAQIDQILMCKKWANTLRKCRAYFSVEIDSDHYIVTANIKISLRTPRKQFKKLYFGFFYTSNSTLFLIRCS